VQDLTNLINAPFLALTRRPLIGSGPWCLQVTVQQDHGAMAPARSVRLLANPAGTQGSGRGPAEVAGRIDWPQLEDSKKPTPTAAHSDPPRLHYRALSRVGSGTVISLPGLAA